MLAKVREQIDPLKPKKNSKRFPHHGGRMMPEYEIARLLAAIYEARAGQNETSLETRLTARALRYYADYLEGIAVRFPAGGPGTVGWLGGEWDR